MSTSQPSLVAWQCWLTLIRLFSSVCVTGLWAWRIDGLRRILQLLAHASAVLQDPLRQLIPPFTGWFAFWIIVVLNDTFMLTIDHKRTHTYLGCMAVQTVVNFCCTFLIILHFALYRIYQAQAGFFSDFALGVGRAYTYPVHVTFGIFALFAGVCSVFILAIEVSAILTLRSTVPIIPLGKTNTKDALSELGPSLSRSHALSVLGNPRAIAIPIHLPQAVTTSSLFIVMLVKRVLAHLLFHRVRNVETRIYALIRNSFASISMIILIFRTITALQQAQNEVQTRVTSAACGLASPSHLLSILVDRPRWDGPYASQEEVNVTVSAIFASNGKRVSGCRVGWSQRFMNDFYPPAYQNRTLELFICNGVSPLDINRWEGQYYSNDAFAYHVQVQPGAKPGTASDGQMPHVWLVNTNETRGRSWSDLAEVRAYQAPLNLLRGSHIVTETNLITRRFIRSSILKDIIFSSKSEYKRLSLYPIFQLSVAALNATTTTIASATIRPALTPGLRYHRTQANIQNPNIPPSDTCDFIDDYRSSTIFNAIGSVGGLFALLQAIHLLLFGRPLLWGVTGAKTITPFGLLGGCSSRGFKRRLREEYHISSEDGTDTIRIVPFLQDFVIDFGPANFDPAQRSPRASVVLSPTQDESNEDLDGTEIPLMQMDLETGAEPPRESDIEDTNHSYDRHSIHTVV
ncbi:transmembrane protein, putative [Rhizoctonia solani AG-3 Rhs1AP]|uniref:Transmembrane protein, putative n=2 Tax=Rhizoctonia solani AG-3 TaxID=1086053 RepID=X8JH00_9AGAM|nr:transmembrane protein, putative [Rhizoctonia solani AG-3 Rhs1AP]KEP50711.1 putative transmembrane protein [Rhizoctonia solani 123E]